MISLAVVRGAEQGRSFEFDGPGASTTSSPIIAVGRAADAQVSLSDWHLSSEHGQIFREDDRYVYRDLRSTNGSRIARGETLIPLDDGERREAVLRDGDQLVLGDPTDPVVLACRVAVDDVPDLGQQVIAVKPLAELPTVAGRVERDPVSALALYQVSKRIGARLELGDVLEAVVGAVLELLPGATHVAVLLGEDDGEERFSTALVRARGGPAAPTTSEGGGAAAPASRAVLRRVLQERAAVLAANAAQEFGGAESIMAARILSILAVPLFSGDRIRGVIQADNRASAGMFRERDLELLTVLAGQATLAVENARLYQRLRVAEEKLRGENRYLKVREEKRRFPGIIGDSPAMRGIFAKLEKVIDTRATVCIEGETGTGKELIASAIHYQGRRRDKLFVAQNCAALPETLLESELFGHKKGAFTGADHDKKGLFELADAGTLFLDEIGDMPLALQAKLLRALQEGEVRPLGSTQPRNVDVRIICATNRSLEKEVERGAFRPDLYYRLMVFPVRLPALRERREDIALLVEHFLRQYTVELKKPIAGLAQGALDQLTAYGWPGNIRELENEVQRLVIQCEPEARIEAELLSPQIRRVEGLLDRIAPKKGTLREMMEQIERWLVAEALREHGGNKTRTADTLGITREGLHKKLAKFGM